MHGLCAAAEFCNERYIMCIVKKIFDIHAPLGIIQNQLKIFIEFLEINLTRRGFFYYIMIDEITADHTVR